MLFSSCTIFMLHSFHIAFLCNFLICGTPAKWSLAMYNVIQQLLDLGSAKVHTLLAGHWRLANGENLWQLCWPEIRLMAFRLSTVTQKQFIIIMLHFFQVSLFFLALFRRTLHILHSSKFTLLHIAFISYCTLFRWHSFMLQFSHVVPFHEYPQNTLNVQKFQQIQPTQHV